MFKSLTYFVFFVSFVSFAVVVLVFVLRPVWKAFLTLETVRIRIRKWGEWEEISKSKYKSLTDSIHGTKNYISESATLPGGLTYAEEDFEMRRSILCQFSSLSTEYSFCQMRPRARSSRYFLRTRDQQGARVWEVYREAWMEPVNGCLTWSDGRPFVSPSGSPLLVIFRHEALIEDQYEDKLLIAS